MPKEVIYYSNSSYNTTREKSVEVLSELLSLREQLLDYRVNQSGSEETTSYRATTNEDELVSFEDFEGTDEEKVKLVLDSIYKLIDLDSKDRITNDELKDIEEVLEQCGISMANLIQYLEENGNEIADDVLNCE